MWLVGLVIRECLLRYFIFYCIYISVDVVLDRERS